MKRFTKLIMLLMVASTLFYSCKKDVTIEDAIASKEVDLSFDLEALGEQFSGLSDALNKNTYTKGDGTEIQYPLCVEDEAAYVEVTMDGQLYTIQFTALSPSQTEVIKVLEGSHTITEFEVFSGGGTAIYSAPHVGSDDDDITTYDLQGLPYTFSIDQFTKNKVDIDVVCWHDYSYQPLAWNWYELNYNQKKTLAFFGNICSKYFDLWDANGYDFVAPIKVILYSSGVEITQGQNFDSTLPPTGVGEVVLEYIDNELEDEHLTAAIFMANPGGSLTLLELITITEGAWSEIGVNGNFGGDDGIFDFQVGNCDTQGNNGADAIYPSYLPLPAGIVQFTATTQNGPGYVNAVFELDGNPNTQTNYGDLLDNADMEMWCAEGDVDIFIGRTYNAILYSSLNTLIMPANLAAMNWGSLNWIMNNRDGYNDAEIQGALWWIQHGSSYVGSSNNSLAQEAAGHSDFVPKVGDWAVIAVDADGLNNQLAVQLMIVRVDP